MHTDTLLLNQSVIKSLITYEEANEIIDRTFQGFGNGTVINPSKVSLDLGETGNYPYHQGFMNAMPAYVGFQDIAGQKWVGGFEGKRQEANLPYITALTFLIDPNYGNFIAVMDGAYISGMRTGAQTAVAIKYLLKRDKVTIGLYGAGEQARNAIKAISAWMSIEHLIVWNHRIETAEQFKKDMQNYAKKISVVTDGKDAAQAEVLITLTPAQEPLIQTDWVKPGTIVMPMGSFQEIEDALILKADKIIVDHIDQALNRGALKSLHDAGKITDKNIYTTYGELAVGSASLDTIDNEIIISIPIGTGAVDVAIAAEIYKKACEKGLGQTFDFLS